MSLKLNNLINEFMRYLVVGGLSFVVDFIVLFLCNEYILLDAGANRLYFATTVAFFAGLLVNYILSKKFVFAVKDNRFNDHNVISFIIFAIIGFVGLLLTNLGMYIGVGLGHINYLIVKIIVTGIVLIWNYGARKIIIFRG